VDCAAYWQAIATHQRSVRRLLMRRYPRLSVMDCEDAVSGGAIQLLDRAIDLNEEDVLRYLFQASRSKALDLLRWRARQYRLEATYGQLHTSVSPGPERVVIARQLLEWYLAHLLPKARLRLIACLDEGSIEVGQARDRSPGAVRAGVWKSLQKLRRLRALAESSRGKHWRDDA
jgi:hypothetical protein